MSPMPPRAARLALAVALGLAAWAGPERGLAQEVPAAGEPVEVPARSSAELAWEELDWEKLLAGPEPVILLGERHDRSSIQEELARLLRDGSARRAGITHLGVEFGDHFQPELDRLCKDGVCPPSVMASIRSDCFPEERVRVFEEAARAGLTIVALDDWKDAFGFGQALRREPEVAALPLRERDRYVGRIVNREREKRMAGHILRVVGEPRGLRGGPRLLALLGDHHVKKGHLPRYLDILSVPHRRYAFVTALFLTAPADYFLMRPAIGSAGLDGKRIVVLPSPGAGESVNATYDGVVSTPDILQDRGSSAAGGEPGPPDARPDAARSRSPDEAARPVPRWRPAEPVAPKSARWD